MERTDSKVLPIEKFSGDPEEFADWVATYRMDAAACDWDEIDMIKRFPLHLTGFARTAYQQLSDDETITWTDLIENFRKKLSLSDNAQSSTQKFCARVQKPGERVIEFAFALRTLAQRAFSGESGLLNEDLVEQLLFNQFITGLRHEIKTHAVMLNVYTFDEAVDKARILEERGLTDRKVAALNDEYSIRRHNYDEQREYERKRERSLSPVIASLLRDKIEKMNFKQQTEDDTGNLSKYYGSKSFDETYREPRMTLLDNENRGGYRSQRYNELNPRQGADDRYQKVSTQRDYNAEVRNQGGERYGGRDNRYEGGNNRNNFRDNYRSTDDYGNNRNRNTDDYYGNNRNNFRNNDGYRNDNGYRSSRVNYSNGQGNNRFMNRNRSNSTENRENMNRYRSPNRNNFNNYRNRSNSPSNRSQNSQGDYELKICDYCQNVGHLRFECRKRKYDIEAKQRNLQRDQVNRNGDIQCYHCKGYGHYARACPQLNGNLFPNSRSNSEERRKVTFDKKVNGLQKDNYVNRQKIIEDRQKQQATDKQESIVNAQKQKENEEKQKYIAKQKEFDEHIKALDAKYIQFNHMECDSFVRKMTRILERAKLLKAKTTAPLGENRKEEKEKIKDTKDKEQDENKNDKEYNSRLYSSYEQYVSFQEIQKILDEEEIKQAQKVKEEEEYEIKKQIQLEAIRKIDEQQAEEDRIEREEKRKQKRLKIIEEELSKPNKSEESQNKNSTKENTINLLTVDMDEDEIDIARGKLSQPNLTDDEVYDTLHRLLKVRAKEDKLITLIPQLRYILQMGTSQTALIKTILQKYGQYVRRITNIDKPMCIQIDSGQQKAIVYVYTHSRVRELREQVYCYYGNDRQYHLEIIMYGQIVMDNEYLTDIGCTPTEENYAFLQWRRLYTEEPRNIQVEKQRNEPETSTSQTISTT